MSQVEEFLGETVAKVVGDLIERHHPGIRIQNVTNFSPEAFLKHLNTEARPRVAVAGAAVQELARKTGFPAQLLTSDLAEATEWRNDPKVTQTVVVIALGEEERLGSFHRFSEIRDRDIYLEICRLAEDTVCPNKVQIDWWSVLRKADVMRQVSVFRLASYYLYLKSKSKQIPEACQWTRIVTRLVNPNCYDARGSPDGAVSSRTAPDPRLPLGLLASIRGSCWFLPGPTGGQGLGPQSLRVPAVSTFGSLHDRGPSNEPVKTHVLPCDVSDGSSRAATTEQNY